MDSVPEKKDNSLAPTEGHAPPQPHAVDDQPQDYRLLLQNLTNKALHFLSNASNETLGACIIGLSATTYVVLGRVGLVLIGIVGGVVLHATWDPTNDASQGGESKAQELNRRREIGLDVAKRVLEWREKKAVDPSDQERDALGIGGVASPIKGSDFSNFRPETGTALNLFTDAVIRDYVKWWYSPIIPADLSFPSTCRRTLIGFIVAFSTNLARKRPVDTFIEFTTNSSSIVIVFFNELASALSASPSASAAEAVDTYLRLKPQSNLASIMDSKHQQRKLQMVADDILESFLEPAVYKCPPARVFLREILADTILEMTIQKCSRADWINEWIVYLLEDGEPELMNAIDAGVEGVSGHAAKSKPEVVQAAVETAVEDDQNDSLAPQVSSPASHARTKSKAEEAMDEAMREAQRLTQLIVEEEEKRKREQQQYSSTDLSDTSDSTNHGAHTPSSSQSEANGNTDQPRNSINPTSTIGCEAPLAEVVEGESQEEAATPQNPAFTSFDQLAPLQVPTALQENQDRRPPSQPEFLTLHRARISIFDDGSTANNRTLKNRPNDDQLIQIEPASSSFSGWMIGRAYADFEGLHEVLRRIATITGVDFNSKHPSLPQWKGQTRTKLKEGLERYLQDALTSEQLAESEGMKKFLDKSRGMTSQSQAKQQAFWTAPASVGKGVVGALSKAPTQVAGGGKAFFGGVASAFGGGAIPKKSSTMGELETPNRSSVDLGRTSPQPPPLPERRSSAQSESVSKPPPSLSIQGNDSRPTLEPRRSSSTASNKAGRRTGVSPRSSVILEQSLQNQRQNVRSPNESPTFSNTNVKLPPPPEAMPDDYMNAPSAHANMADHISHMSVDGTNFFDVPTPPTPRSPRPRSPPSTSSRSPTVGGTSSANGRSPNPSRAPPQNRPSNLSTTQNLTSASRPASSSAPAPLNEQEAQVTIELMFAVINELYTLSSMSVWNIRRTLLNAAKTFLLRPGNPQLESIRILLQESVLDANSSDAGVAAHVLKLRENTLPTEEELAKWPKERNEEEKEALRKKARKLLCQRGMPQALTSVMGQASSGEALGKVFDCLQCAEVARGVTFGLVLQGVRAATQ